MVRKATLLLVGMGLVLLGLSLSLNSSVAQEEKKEEAKPLEVTGLTKVGWTEVPAAVKAAIAKETGYNYAWNKGKADGKDVYVITFKRFGQGTKLVLAADGKVLLREVVESPTAAKDPKAGKVPGKVEEKAPVVVAKGGPTYAKDIRPILNANCKNCHDVAKRKADLDLITSYNTVMEAVKPGMPGASLLYLAVTGNGAKRMPPDKRLDPADVAAIKAWIAGGAKEK
jgi:hypothetical protein